MRLKCADYALSRAGERSNGHTVEHREFIPGVNRGCDDEDVDNNISLRLPP